MDIDSFPSAESSVPSRNIDLPPDNVFVAPLAIMGQNKCLIENATDIQTSIRRELANAGVTLAMTEAEAKMRLDYKITVCPVHKSRVPTELLRPNTEYSSIVVEIQLTQKHNERLRQPYTDSSGICIDANENLTLRTKQLINELLEKLTK